MWVFRCVGSGSRSPRRTATCTWSGVCWRQAKWRRKDRCGQCKELETQSQTALAQEELLRSKECKRMTICTQTENECGAVFVRGVPHHPSGSSSASGCFRIVLQRFEKSPAHRPSSDVAITTLVTASSRARMSWSFAMRRRHNCKGSKILHLIAQCCEGAAVVSEHVLL